MRNEEQELDRTARIERLEYDRELTANEKQQVEFFIQKLEDTKSSLRGVAREQAQAFITKLKTESESLQQIEQEIEDSIYFVQGY